MDRWTSVRGALAALLVCAASMAVACTSTEVAVLATDSPALLFGDLAPGDSATRTLTLRNDGGGAVLLDDATISDDDEAAFTVLTALAGTELSGGGAVEVELQFSPGRDGDHEALLTLSGTQPSLSGGAGTSDGLSVFPAEVLLLGTGLAAGDDDSAGDDDDTGDDDTGDDDDSTGDDIDGDGFVDLLAGGNDCDDTDAATFPGATELCDGIDNDCDLEIDEGLSVTWYADSDADGYGGQLLTEVACDAPAGYADNNDDCDDLDPDTSPGEDELCNGQDDDCDGQVDEQASDASTWYLDADQDSHGGTFLSQQSCTAPSGYVASSDDCNDLNPATFPGAAELCDDEDNNCDSQVDEGVGVTWYLDDDGDDYGITATTEVACNAPAGYAAVDGDCNDGDASIHPGATELCDGTDRNCDGNAGVITWYQDSDGDGYGDPGTTTTSCASPPGFSSNSDDCDDAVASTNPGSFEICDGSDNNCDGQTDDASALNAGTWFEDADGDGYGTSANSVTACAQPAGFADNAGDCNDSVGSGAAINPAASETCDGTDNDCDGDVDEDATNAGNWYPDTDGDGDGDDSAAAVIACSPPGGHVANQDDCDDTNAAVSAGAPEICDGIDNNCDGFVDSSGGANFCLYGDGRDGDVVINGATPDYNDNILGNARSGVADGIQTTVGANPDSTTLQVASSSGFAAGDFALLINLQGDPGDVADVGNWEVVSITGAPDANTVQIATPPTRSYDGGSFAGQAVVLQRLPQWNNVTVTNGGLMVASDWDGSGGGILAFMVSGTLTIDSSSGLTMNERGYRGGAGNQENGPGSWSTDGEGRTGLGTAADENPNDNGGGGAFSHGGLVNANAGGGSYASRDPGPFGNQGQSTISGLSGDVVGDAALSQLNFGGGGGGCTNQNVLGSDGGDGGGIIFVQAQTMSIDGGIANNGQNGFVCGSGDPSNASGGAGGAIYLVADSLSYSGQAVEAIGGSAASNGNNGQGAAGGDGRIRLEYSSIGGSNPYPSVSDETAIAQPDPGSSSTPGG